MNTVYVLTTKHVYPHSDKPDQFEEDNFIESGMPKPNRGESIRADGKAYTVESVVHCLLTEKESYIKVYASRTLTHKPEFIPTQP